MDANQKPDKENKKKPGKIKSVEIDFFEELPILLTIKDIKPFIVFMRPLKVKEIQILNRIAHLQEKNPVCERALMMLVGLAVETLDVTSGDIPVEATSGLVTNMIEFNFPPENEDEKKKTDGGGQSDLVSCFDFLIKNGHNYNNILEYPIPLFNNFIVTIAERLGMKKKPLDAAAAFRKLGVPVVPRGSKK